MTKRMDQTGPMGRVLIIAGSDSGGGAGIQADIKTVTMLGGYAATAITCVTVQNTLGVTGVHAVPADVVYSQIRAILDDIGTDVIKTGMLYNSDIIRACFKAIEDSGFTGPVIVDPVMVATSGAPLLQQEAIELYRTDVLARATIMTPNIPELSVLAAIDIETAEDVKQAVHKLRGQGLNAVLAKGGHLMSTGDKIWNYYQDGDQTFDFTVPRLPSRNTHGTGCTMASALAAVLADHIANNHGANPCIQDACQTAADFVQQAIEKAPDLGTGAGPMGHARVILQVKDN